MLVFITLVTILAERAVNLNSAGTHIFNGITGLGKHGYNNGGRSFLVSIAYYILFCSIVSIMGSFLSYDLFFSLFRGVWTTISSSTLPSID